MTTTHRLAALFACTAALLAPCVSAQVFMGSDNFNDNSLTIQTGAQLPGQWRFSFPNSAGSNGALTETNGRMEYTTTATSGFNRGQLGWSSPSSSVSPEGAVGLSNGTPYASNWVAQVSVTNTVQGLLDGAYTGLGLEIYTLAAGNTNNGYYGVSFRQNAYGAHVVTEWGTWSPDANNFIPGGEGFGGSAFDGVTSAILRMSYDGSAKSLQFSYSLDAGATYLVGTTIDLAGAHAGPEEPLNGGIGLRLIAFTNNGAGPITSGQMTFDNFSVTPSAIPEPSTYAALAGVLALGLVAWRRRRAA